MSTRSNVLAMTSAALLMGVSWTGSVIAQELSPNMPGPGVDRASCDDIEWHRDMLLSYPWIVEGCQEAVVVDGEKWARFEAEFQQLHSDGAITSKFKTDRGRVLGNVRLMPGADQRVLLDGRPYRFSQLKRGQTLNFYVPEDVFGFTTAPVAPASQVVEIYEPQIVEEPPERMAEAQPVATERPTTLPATAGPMPIIALGGVLSLLGALGMTARRRFKTPKA